MKKCTNCNILIGGQVKSCPLCQNSLIGEASEGNWPVLERFKKKAFFYKLQLFIVLAAAVVSLCLDFLMDINVTKHWSIIVAIGLIMAELVLRGLLKKNFVIAKIISMTALHAGVLLIIIGWFWGFLDTVIYLIIPIMISATLVANFVFSLLDKTENALVYLLVNILISVLPYLILTLYKHVKPIPWTVCLMLSILTLIGMVIFKGPKVVREVEKRMNF